MSTKVISRKKVTKAVAEMAQEAPQLEVATSPKAPQYDSSLAALLAAHMTPPANILNSILIQGQSLLVVAESQSLIHAVQALFATGLSAGENTLGFSPDHPMTTVLFKNTPGDFKHAHYLGHALAVNGVDGMDCQLQILGSAQFNGKMPKFWTSSGQSELSQAVDGADLVMFNLNARQLCVTPYGAFDESVMRACITKIDHWIAKRCSYGQAVIAYDFGLDELESSDFIFDSFDAVLVVEKELPTEFSTFGGCSARWVKPEVLPLGESQTFVLHVMEDDDGQFELFRRDLRSIGPFENVGVPKSMRRVSSEECD